MSRYWINTISKDHVLRGVEAGFTQAGHGALAGVKRLSRGDGIIFYSPKTTLQNGEPLQAFTALGYVSDDEPYQVQMTLAFHPWRRNIEFDRSVHEKAIRPMIEQLSFIKNPQRWGFIFRRGLFEIPEADFELIKTVMILR